MVFVLQFLLYMQTFQHTFQGVFATSNILPKCSIIYPLSIRHSVQIVLLGVIVEPDDTRLLLKSLPAFMPFN